MNVPDDERDTTANATVSTEKCSGCPFRGEVAKFFGFKKTGDPYKTCTKCRLEGQERRAKARQQENDVAASVPAVAHPPDLPEDHSVSWIQTFKWCHHSSILRREAVRLPRALKRGAALRDSR